MKEFEVGATYVCRSACDHECIWTLRVISRTKTTITAEHDVNGMQVQRFRVHDFCGKGVECVDVGRYSMHPVFRADIQ